MDSPRITAKLKLQCYVTSIILVNQKQRECTCLVLKWQGGLLAEVNKNINLAALQSGPGLLLVSGLGFALGQSCFAEFFY